jgi:hypothetical protein
MVWNMTSEDRAFRHRVAVSFRNPLNDTPCYVDADVIGTDVDSNAVVT